MFQNFADPVMQIIEKYFQDKRMISANFDTGTQSITPLLYAAETLPQNPQRFIRDDNNKVVAIVHGDINALNDPEADPIIWREDFVRENNKVVAITTTYPNGNQITQNIIRENGKVVGIE